jgi:hypothetical protein
MDRIFACQRDAAVHWTFFGFCFPSVGRGLSTKLGSTERLAMGFERFAHLQQHEKTAPVLRCEDGHEKGVADLGRDLGGRRLAVYVLRASFGDSWWWFQYL